MEDDEWHEDKCLRVLNARGKKTKQTTYFLFCYCILQLVDHPQRPSTSRDLPRPFVGHHRTVPSTPSLWVVWVSLALLWPCASCTKGYASLDCVTLPNEATFALLMRVKRLMVAV